MSNVPILVVGNKQDLIANNDDGNSGGSGIGSGSGGGLSGGGLSCGNNSGKTAITCGNDEKRRDIANLVKKHWKCGYIECSAKYNWKVVSLFKELINMIDNIEIRDQSPMLDNIQEALDRNKCLIL